MSTEIKEALQTSMKAFEEFKSSLAPKLEKLDSLDMGTFNKIATDIGRGIEQSQAAEAKARAAEEGIKQVEKQVDLLTAALNRVSPGGNTEDRVKGLRRKSNKLFNEFSRLDRGNSQIYFDEYVKECWDKDPELKAMSA